jgi:hypothetical protein
MFFDLYDLFQNIRIREASHQARRARDLAGDLDTRLEELERQLLMVKATSEALWTFIKRHHGLEDTDLVNMLKEQASQREQELALEEPVQHCPACGKALQKSTGSCIYCGHKADPAPFAR